MKLEFKPVDFYSVHLNSDYHINAAKLANARLAEMLKDASVFYGRKEIDFSWSKERGDDDTHKALLINIELIAKDPCKHIPAFDMAMPNKCRECGVTLYIHWSDKPSGETQGGVK